MTQNNPWLDVSEYMPPSDGRVVEVKKYNGEWGRAIYDSKLQRWWWAPNGYKESKIAGRIVQWRPRSKEATDEGRGL